MSTGGPYSKFTEPDDREGFHGGSNVEGTDGDHCLLCPPYNIAKAQVEEIVDVLVRSVEEVLDEFSV